MSAKKILGIILLAAGILALVYGGFTYTDTHETDLGPIELSVKEKDRFDIPIWAGVAAVVAGAALLVVGKK